MTQIAPASTFSLLNKIYQTKRYVTTDDWKITLRCTLYMQQCM